MLVVVDYGLGNPRSILNMLQKIGAAAVVAGDPAVVAGAEKLILPGVGACRCGGPAKLLTSMSSRMPS